jgi:hypothetical protein
MVWSRLALVVLALGLAYEVWGHRRIGPAWFWASVGVFLLLSVAIELVARGVAARQAIATYYDAGLARVEERWQGGVADTGDAFADEGHLYALDLDLFGRGGLFGLLSTARTSLGKETLAGWLKARAGAEEVRGRQAAVRELARRHELREGIWQAGGRVSAEVAADRLERWLSEPAPAVGPWARPAALLLALCGVPAVWGLTTGRVPLALAIFIAQWIFASRLRAARDAVVRGAGRRAEELKVVQALIARFEAESFECERLLSLKRELATGGGSSRQRLRGLVRLVELLEARRNVVFGLVTAPFLPATQLALAISAWRREHGPVTAGWVRAVGQIEALTSLATYAFEHPRAVFPTIVPEAEGPLYEAEALAHPLLPAATRVANDVSLGRGPRLIVVTGSNMSGKSTFLRTVGINAVLALAGAPVTAAALRLSPLAIGATLRVQDSLQAGTSRFLAEITRLREIVEQAERSRHVLFLLDELLHGTNSADRHTGGEGILRVLVERGAIGIATTHDLSLASLADSLAPAAINAHFQDRVEAGRLVFDYKMRPGVVSRSNALDLMRLVGLKV